MKNKEISRNFNYYNSILPKYKSYSLHNYKHIPQIYKLSEEQQFEIDVVGRVFPFKTNSYVINKLIDWDNVPNDPMFILTFPQKGMLLPHHYEEMAGAIRKNLGREKIETIANKIRYQLNPHPAGQLEYNVPELYGEMLPGMQHKYTQTLLFFPSQGQTCHAYCSFCFRWPQFVGMDDYKFATRETDNLIEYLQLHPEVTDILITGGDPMIMKARILAQYIEPLIDANLPNLQTIRIGTKSLSFWPYKYLDEHEGTKTLSLFRKIVRSGKHLALMAHFSHPRELGTKSVREAIKRIRETGTAIRTQSPLLRHINDDSEVWAEMWRKQVKLGCIPYYMFVVRDTGAQHYFGVPLVKAWEIFRKAYRNVSGLARTVRGPSMSATPGKIQVLGVDEIHGEKVIALNMLQARRPDLVMRPFFAKYDDKAIWIDELKPAFWREKFFFEE